MSKGRAGFLLLEVIPAMLLLATVALLGTRLLWLSTEMGWRTEEHNRGIACFPLVLDCWNKSASQAAVVVYSETDGLEVLEFPDSSWLPESVQPDAKTRSLWRRREFVDETGGNWWTVEYKVPGMEEWRWFSRVMRVNQSQPMKDNLP